MDFTLSLGHSRVSKNQPGYLRLPLRMEEGLVNDHLS